MNQKNRSLPGPRQAANSNRMSENVQVNVKGSTVPKMLQPETSTGTSTPNVEGILSPRTEASASAFCTSSEDVLSAFNFSAENDADAFGYDRENVQESPKITLVCGDLFRRISRNVNTLASILTEPENKSLLQNFLEDFHENKLVPWAVGSALRHWCRRFSLIDEESTDYPLPYLKTTKVIGPNGEVNDPGALDRLEKLVQNYLDELARHSTFGQAVESLSTFVNYITDAEGHLSENQIMNSPPIGDEEPIRPRNIQETYNEIREELRQAEAELEELVGASWARSSATPSTTTTNANQQQHESRENLLLHRIAGFDSFVGLSTRAISQTETSISGTLLSGPLQKSHESISTLVIPIRSGIVGPGFTPPTQLATIGDPRNQLSPVVSFTLLASASSRIQLHMTQDENANFPVISTLDGIVTEKELMEDEKWTKNFVEHDNPEMLELASDLERTAMDMEAEKRAVALTEDMTAIGNEPLTEAEKPAAQPPPSSTPLKVTAIERLNGAKSPPVAPRNGVLKREGHGSVGHLRLGKPPLTSSSNHRGRDTKPQVAFGRKVEPLCKTSRVNAAPSNASKPTGIKSNASYRKVTPIKVSPGSRRIEFTKVKQTNSYRQLNEESLKQLQQRTASLSQPKVGQIATVNTPSPVPGSSASASERELAQLVQVEQKLGLTQNQAESGAACGSNAKKLASTPSSAQNSRVQSKTNLTDPISKGMVKQKPVVTYGQIQQLKKRMEATNATAKHGGSPKKENPTSGISTKRRF